MPNWSFKISAILCLGFVLRLIVFQTPFLGTWDERYHALVAKNLIEHPFKPTLYDEPVLDYDYKEWSSNHIWLSKPPLALWMMAGSMYIFGIEEAALRLPSLLLGVICIYLTYVIGYKLYGYRVALFASFLHAIHGLTIEVTGGRLSSDHVDSLFLFLFQLSIIFIIDYFSAPHKKIRLVYAVLIGLMTGLAFMTKWIVAGFIPILWLSVFFVQKLKWKTLKIVIADGIIVAFTASIITLPLLFYLFDEFPVESKYFVQSTVTPIQKTIQGHSYPWFFYFDCSRIVFGEIIYLPMLWILYKVINKILTKANEDSSRMSNSNLILIALIFIPLVLLSLMQTKRNVYILLSSVGFFVLTGLFYHFVRLNISSIRLPKAILVLILILLWILPLRYSIERIKPFKKYEVESKIVENGLFHFFYFLSLPPFRNYVSFFS